MAKRSVKSKPRTLADHLARSESSGLIRLAQLEPEVEYLFRHALVQEAAYWSLLREQRKSIHLAIGEVIEKLYPDRLGELAPVLAQHFDEGGDLARALHYYQLAGDSAADRYANDEAIMAYGRALTLAEAQTAGHDRLLHLYSRKGRAEELSGRYDDALATYEAMEQTARATGDRALELSALSSRATIFSTYTSRVDPGRGVALSERALALAREIGDEPAQAKILWNLMLVRYAVGSHGDAIRYGEESLAIARRLNLREQIAFTLHDLAGALLSSGELERAQTVRAEARALWRELDNKAMLADNLIAAAMPLVVMGRYGDGLAMIQEGLQISQSIGNAWGQSYANMGLGYINTAIGELGQAITNCRESVRLGEIAGFGYATIFSRCVEALTLSYLGQPEQGLELVEAARALTDETVKPVAAIPIVIEMAIQMAQGNLARTETLLQEAVLDIEWDDPTPRMIMGIARAELLLAQARPREAIQATEDLLSQVAAPIEANIFVYVGKVARGRAQLALGDVSGALATLEKLLQEYDRTGAHFFRWEALAALAEVAQTGGDTAKSIRARAAARDELSFIISRIRDAELEASFQARPDVRAVLEG